MSLPRISLQIKPEHSQSVIVQSVLGLRVMVEALTAMVLQIHSCACGVSLEESMKVYTQAVEEILTRTQADLSQYGDIVLDKDLPSMP